MSLGPSSLQSEQYDHEGETDEMTKFLKAAVNPAYPDVAHGEHLSAYVNYVQQTTLPAIQALLVDSGGGPEKNTTSESALKVTTHILSMLKSEACNKVTIDLVVERCFTNTNSDLVSSARLRNQHRKIVFHIISVATLLHKAIRDDISPHFQCQSGVSTSRSIEFSFSQRPILALLKQLGTFHSHLHSGSSGGHQTEDNSQQQAVLDIANISASALYRIGDLTLVWVDSLDQHLQFDADLRQLGIFRFPSFCVAAQSSKAQSMLFWAVNLSHQSHLNHVQAAFEGDEMRVRSLVQELLLTYRLVFSRDKGSRRLFRKRLRAEIEGSCYDSLLDNLCATTDSKFRHDQDDFLVQIARQGNRFRVSEFPHFGQRLFLLQEFMLKHRPNKLIDLYRDRRDREKFFTFWAVIVFGTFAVVLGIIQTLLSAAQFVITYKQWKDSHRL